MSVDFESCHLVNLKSQKKRDARVGLVIAKAGKSFCRFEKSDRGLLMRCLDRELRVNHNGNPLVYNAKVILRDGDLLGFGALTYEMSMRPTAAQAPSEEEVPVLPSPYFQWAVCLSLMVVIAALFFQYQSGSSKSLTARAQLSPYLMSTEKHFRQYQDVLNRYHKGRLTRFQAQQALEGGVLVHYDHLYSQLHFIKPVNTVAKKRQKQIIYTVKGLRQYVFYVSRYLATEDKRFQDRALELEARYSTYFKDLMEAFYKVPSPNQLVKNQGRLPASAVPN